MAEFETTVQDGVGEIRITRPEVKNALSSDVRSDIVETLYELEANSAVDVILFSGEGDNFCSGGDLREFDEFESTPYALYYLSQSWRQLYNVMTNLDKPIVTKAHGRIIGGGMNMLLYSDIVFASDEAEFGVPEIEIGLVTGNGSGMLPHVIGVKKTLELLMLGELLSAEEAERLGVVTRSIPKEQLDDEIRAATQRLSSYSPHTLKKMKEIVYGSFERSPDSAVEYAIWESYQAARASPDFDEGREAFLESREPEWSNQL